MVKPVKKKAVSKAVAVKQEQLIAINTANEMIQLAITNKSDLSQVRELLALKKEFEADEARKAYHASMVMAQQNMPVIEKTLKNAQTHSKYAALDRIIQKAKPVYTREGFSVSFHEGITDKPEHIRVCADVVHRLGHKESPFYDVPMDGKGIHGKVNMTTIHGKASSMSYGQRYLMRMIWNIPTGDDIDGNSPEPQKEKVSMPQSTKAVKAEVVEPENDESSENAPEPAQNQSFNTGPSKPITKDKAKWLFSLAKSNKYTKEEFFHIIGLLGYGKVIDISEQDYETILLEIKKPAEEYRKNQETIQQEVWDE